MRTIRKTRKRKTLVFALIPLIIGFGLIGSSFTKFTPFEKKAFKQFDVHEVNPESLFRQIMFSEGEIVEHVPLLKNKNVKKKRLSNDLAEDINRVEDLVIAKIKKENPEYFSDFKRAVISRNHYAIKEKLIESYDLIIKDAEFVNSLSKQNKLELDNMVAELKSGNFSQSTFEKVKFDEFARLESQVDPDEEEFLIIMYVYIWIEFDFLSMPTVANASTLKNNSLELDKLVENIVNI
ncbi:MAG: hypothetical protein ACTIKA_10840 [Psychroflexus halocasei]